MSNDIRIQLSSEVAGEETLIEANALGAVLDIHGGDNDDKTCMEGWENHMATAQGSSPKTTCLTLNH